MSTYHEQFVVDEQGKPTGVFLPLAEYRQLMEDLHDLTVVAKRRKEKTISLDDLRRRLKKDGGE